LLGNTIDSVFWSAHCPVAVMRLLDEPIKIRSILVPVKNMTPQALHAVQFAQLFADANQATVLLLHVGDRQTSKETIDAFETEFAAYMNQSRLTVDWTIQTICQDDIAEAIVKAARSFDMVVLRSVRRRTVAGLAVSDVTTQVLSEITCSAVLFGEPHA
ncbi:MAG: universal stress protein, partial [Coleofasciculaceae cyanobacterium SM2_3_26]|nr:universal stress protein [Coleofasciculaceae cyanobacterium SM2_3_26]